VWNNPSRGAGRQRAMQSTVSYLRPLISIIIIAIIRLLLFLLLLLMHLWLIRFRKLWSIIIVAKSSSGDAQRFVSDRRRWNLKGRLCKLLEAVDYLFSLLLIYPVLCAIENWDKSAALSTRMQFITVPLYITGTCIIAARANDRVLSFFLSSPSSCCYF